MNQEQIFVSSEADKYFLRNKEVLDSFLKEQDNIYKLIKKFNRKEEITSVLELGCATGYRLNFLKDILSNCNRFVGMDASGLAIEHGKQKYGLELYQDSFGSFNYPEQFDLVIVNFVLHWIDRDLLYQCVANIDKFLKPQNSFLVLGDFYPFYSHKRKYHHVEKDLFTYKCDYKEIFLCSNMYQILDEIITTHNKNEKISNLSRISVSLLEKNSTEFYELRN